MTLTGKMDRGFTMLIILPMAPLENVLSIYRKVGIIALSVMSLFMVLVLC
jgi:hypothetical protein